jgi:hypothetical protein
VKRETWWYGWVDFTYVGDDGLTREARRTTDYDFATAGQAQRAADALAGALAAPDPLSGWERKYRSKTDKRPSRLTVIATGASRTERA